MAIRNQFRIEFRRHFTVFCVLTSINLAVSLFFSLNYKGNMAFNALLINMVVAILLPIYIFVDYYQEFFVGKTILNHMLPIKTFDLFIVKSLVFLIGSMMVWAGSLVEVFFNPQGLYQTRIIESSSIFLGISYLVLSKLAGTVCGLAIMGFSIAASKQTHRRSYGNLVIAFIILLCVGILFSFIVSETAHWSIGTSALQSFKQYAGPLTISNVYEESVADINVTIRWMSVVRNIVVAIISVLLAKVCFNSRKYEIYGI